MNLFTYLQSKNNFKTLILIMCDDEVILLEVPQVVVVAGAVNSRSTRMLVFRANWAEPRLSHIALVMLLSLDAAWSIS